MLLLFLDCILSTANTLKCLLIQTSGALSYRELFQPTAVHDKDLPDHNEVRSQHQDRRDTIPQDCNSAVQVLSGYTRF